MIYLEECQTVVQMFTEWFVFSASLEHFVMKNRVSFDQNITFLLSLEIRLTLKQDVLAAAHVQKLHALDLN